MKSLTKHKQDVFDKDYLCELCIQVMTTIAGFKPNDVTDPYFVPRGTIGLPGSLNPGDLANALFPKLAEWRLQYSSENGDKSNSSKEFLYSVIIYISEVICQDGVFWVKNHERNPAVAEVKRLLDGRTGTENYVTWTQRKVREIQQKVQVHQTTKLETKDLQAKLVTVIEETMQSQKLLASSIQETIKLNAILTAQVERTQVEMAQVERTSVPIVSGLVTVFIHVSHV